MPKVNFIGGVDSEWFGKEADPDTHRDITNWSNDDFPSAIDAVRIGNYAHNFHYAVLLSLGDVSIATLEIDASSSLTLFNSTGLRTALGVTIDESGTKSGTLNIGGGQMSVGTDIVNHGTIKIATVSFGTLSLGADHGDSSLTGGGIVAMSGGSITGSSASVATILHNVDNIIRGQGTIGTGGTDETFGYILTLDNQAAGKVNATGTLNINTTVANAGLLEATGGGTLELQANITQSGNGRIVASGATAAVYIDATVFGGKLNSDSGGAVHTVFDTAVLDSTTAAGVVHNLGRLIVDPGATLTVNGELNNQGSVTLQSSSQDAYFKIAAGGATLTGGGSVILKTGASDSNENVLTGVSSSIASHITNVNNTISGAGTIGSYFFFHGLLDIDNQADGRINANNAAASLAITDVGLHNEGLIESTNAGGLIITNVAVLQSASGTVEAFGKDARVTLQDTSVIDGSAVSIGNGAQILLQNAVMDGASLSSGNGGEFLVVQHDFDPDLPDPWVSVLDGSTDFGILHTSARVVIGSEAILELDGAIVNSGQVIVHSVSQGASLQVGSASATLSGGGDIVMTSDTVGSNLAQITGNDTATRVTLHNVNNTISGTGSIGNSQQSGDNGYLLALDNQAGGTIDANLAGGILNVHTGTTLSNKGILEADGGTLVVADAVNGSGHAMVMDGGTLKFTSTFNQDVTFAGGAGAGTALFTQAYGGTVSGFSSGDTLDLRSAGFFTLAETDPVTWTENAQQTGGVLSISLQTTSTPVTIHMNGIYTTSSFTLVNDGVNDVDVRIAGNVFEGTSGDDVLTGTTGNDTFVGLGGHDTLAGLAGSDTADFSDKKAAVTVALDGSNNVTVSVGGTGEDTIRNIENIIGGSGNDTITGDSGANTLNGYDGADTLSGGDGKDILIGGIGADTLTGGAQADTFVYKAAAESSGTHFDTINGFVFGQDQFNVAGTINKIETAVTGTLESGAHFDADLAGLVTLGAKHAVLVTADSHSGSLSGDVFLVIDQNGHAGYQSGEDLVIHLNLATGTLTVADFV